MTVIEVLTEIEKLTLTERIALIEETLRLIRRDIAGDIPSKKSADKKMPLAEAAAFLLADYKTDVELTAFTALDAEAFYEAQ